MNHVLKFLPPEDPPVVRSWEAIYLMKYNYLSMARSCG